MALVDAAVSLVVDAALGVWLGSIVFFSFVAAPRVFAVLEEDRAGAVVTDVFPRYYVFGLGLGAVALLGSLVRVVGDATLVAGALSAAIAVGLAANAYARLVLIPAMDDAGEDAFAAYHRQSVLLNGVTLLATAAGLVLSHLPAGSA